MSTFPHEACCYTTRIEYLLDWLRPVTPGIANRRKQMRPKSAFSTKSERGLLFISWELTGHSQQIDGGLKLTGSIQYRERGVKY